MPGRTTHAPLTVLRGQHLDTPHAILTRDGGCSPPPFASLNLSYGVGDQPENVTLNRERVKHALGVDFLASAVQVHGTRIHLVEDLDRDAEVQGYDALITDRPGIGLLIQQADCQAVLLHDPDRKVVAAIHCGWRGNAGNIIAGTVQRMREAYRTNPADLRALISPSLGPCCAEFKNYQQEFPSEMHSFQLRPSYFDLWRLSAAQLAAAGVPWSQIEFMGVCTVCNPAYFSYRRSKKEGLPTTGRNGSVILLQRR
ncbi:MAG: peptidoglycan editing factor PgeF [Desulfobulbus sp.]|nr:MAG: peptidoglycan editing factor PgeF [Desulfobulbus sp.]